MQTAVLLGSFLYLCTAVYTGCERCMMHRKFLMLHYSHRRCSCGVLQSSNNILNLESLRRVVRAITMSH